MILLKSNMLVSRHIVLDNRFTVFVYLCGKEYNIKLYSLMYFDNEPLEPGSSNYSLSIL